MTLYQRYKVWKKQRRLRQSPALARHVHEDLIAGAWTSWIKENQWREDARRQRESTWSLAFNRDGVLVGAV